MKINPLNDYLDGDLSYLLGLLVARGTMINSNQIRQITIEFPFVSLRTTGITKDFNQEQSIRLGLIDIQERLAELLETDIQQIKQANSINLVIKFMRNNLIWRDLLLLLNNQTSFSHFQVPSVFFDPECPLDWKKEFIKGFADVAGNIRSSNNYFKRHRVRLDVLNFPTNWELPVQICTLLQEHINIPVQLITWGHPNLGRQWREHQINIFANSFLEVGFTFPHKQEILEEFAKWNNDNLPPYNYSPCPGIKPLKKSKDSTSDEDNSEKLDTKLVGNHYDSYWQICRALGCQRWSGEIDNQLDSQLDNIDNEDE